MLEKLSPKLRLSRKQYSAWEDYELAAEEMLLKTSTPQAPWTIVESNDKWYGRIKVLKTIVGPTKESAVAV